MKYFMQDVSKLSPTRRKILMNLIINKTAGQECLSNPDGRIAICRDGRKIIGWCGVDDLDTINLIIHPDYRGNGYGTKLAEFFAKESFLDTFICCPRKEFPAGTKIFKKLQAANDPEKRYIYIHRPA